MCRRCPSARRWKTRFSSARRRSATPSRPCSTISHRRRWPTSDGGCHMPAQTGTTITMPQLGESVTEGTIGNWLKQVGDRIEKYEPLVEVETDKASAEI